MEAARRTGVVLSTSQSYIAELLPHRTSLELQKAGIRSNEVKGGLVREKEKQKLRKNKGE